MPYIKTEDRQKMCRGDMPKTAGELNYVITLLCQEYFTKTTQNYQAINDIVGALENCKLEFYRRLVAPHEDSKIRSNGDVYNVRIDVEL